MKHLLLVAAAWPALAATTSSWLDLAGPMLTSGERKLYREASPAEREQIEAGFFADKAIGREEYSARVAAIDARFGGGKPGSGANTDQGRVWLALGAPSRVKRLPSSRVFVPLEIWYYDTIPGFLSTEARLVFYQKTSGPMRLYAPGLENIRTMLVPQAATRNMFGPNDSVTESDIRKILRTSPAEDEVIAASVGVANGVKGSGNQEILSQITSPQYMLRRKPVFDVKSRLVLARGSLRTLETIRPEGPAGFSQIDLSLDTPAKNSIEMEVLTNNAAIYRSRVELAFDRARQVIYTHRLDLLPGAYRLLITIDNTRNVFPLEIKGRPEINQIVRVNAAAGRVAHVSPLEFDGAVFERDAAGSLALLPLARPGNVRWTLRRGTETVWRADVTGKSIAAVPLPSSLPPGTYSLEALTEDGSASCIIVLPIAAEQSAQATVISFNANLALAERAAFAGRQLLLRGRWNDARALLAENPSQSAQVDLARLDALEGKLDEARDRIRALDSFEALSVLAFIETRFQDYAAAAELYRKALALQDSAELRAALASILPSRDRKGAVDAAPPGLK